MKAIVLLAILAGLSWGTRAAQSAPSDQKHRAKPAFRPANVHSDPSPAFRRFALVVGVNDGGASRIRLRYAGTDATAFSDVLVELGGVSRDDLLLLRDPSRAAFLEAMETLRRRIIEASAKGVRAEMLVYFSGHSDEAGLIFGKEKVAYPEFRARIDAAPARIRLAVVDACASGALTRLKGGSRLPAFSVDQSSNLSGYAFLTSSSGAESAQESDRIRASFFTHFLVTGLRGGADRNQDGKVTLGEAYEFAFQETLSQTEGTQAGAQHPSYDMRLTGTGDLVLTDLRGTSAGLVLDPKLRGRIFVRGASGALVAELQKQPGKRIELGLEPGIYDLSLDRGDSLFRALIKVDTLVHMPVALKDFEPAVRERTRNRGGSDSAVSDSPADTGYDSRYAAASAQTHPAAPTSGPAAATTPADARGVPQSGMTPSLAGPDRPRSLWNGIRAGETAFDERSMLRTAFLLGGRSWYNYLSFDMKARAPRHLWGGSAGAGAHFPYRAVFADLDAGFGVLWNDVDWDNYSFDLRFRGLAGVRPFRGFSLFGGVTFNTEFWPGSRYPNLNPGRDGEFMNSSVRSMSWPGFVLGVRI